MEYQMESGFKPGFSSWDFGYSALFGMGDPFSHPSGSNILWVQDKKVKQGG